jgi:hypothetical protein
MSTTDTAHDFEDRNNYNDPPNWVSLVWRLTKTRPAFWMFALLCIYAGVRIYSNADPLDPVFDTAKSKVGTAIAIPDLNGDWVYISHDTNTGKIWGGSIIIEASKEGRFEKFTLRGRRTWEAESDNGPRQEIKGAVPWDADGVAYLADQIEIRWRYNTHEGSTREGVALVNVNKGNLEGRFSDICNVTEPRWGPMELQRTHGS